MTPTWRCWYVSQALKGVSFWSPSFTNNPAAGRVEFTNGMCCTHEKKQRAALMGSKQAKWMPGDMLVNVKFRSWKYIMFLFSPVLVGSHQICGCNYHKAFVAIQSSTMCRCQPGESFYCVQCSQGFVFHFSTSTLATQSGVVVSGILISLDSKSCVVWLQGSLATTFASSTSKLASRS